MHPGYLRAIAVLVLTVPILAQELSVPVVAKRRHAEYRIDPSGERTLLWERRGHYYRSSLGSILLVTRPFVGGQEQGDAQGVFTDATTGRIYELFWKTKQAVLRQQVPVPLRHSKPNVSNSIAGETVVNGVRCFGFRAIGHNVIRGVSWISVEQALLVRTELEGGGRRPPVVVLHC